MEFTGAGEDLAFLRDALVVELNARGINAVTDAPAGGDVLALEVNRFYFRNRRTSGFSPWITFTNFRAKVTYQGRAETVTSYFHAGKVPMWSMDEVVEPTYNYPWRVVVREVVSGGPKELDRKRGVLSEALPGSRYAASSWGSAAK